MISPEENESNQVPKTSSDSLTSLGSSPDPQKTGLLVQKSKCVHGGDTVDWKAQHILVVGGVTVIIIIVIVSIYLSSTVHKKTLGNCSCFLALKAFKFAPNWTEQCN